MSHNHNHTQLQCWKHKIPRTGPVPPQLLLSLSAQGCQDRSRDSLARWRHLWLRAKVKKMSISRTKIILTCGTFAATTVCRARRWWWHLPESNTRGWVVTDAWEVLSTFSAAVMTRFKFIVVVAVKFSRESAGLARSGKDWEGADWTCWWGLIFDNNNQSLIWIKAWQSKIFLKSKQVNLLLMTAEWAFVPL